MTKKTHLSIVRPADSQEIVLQPKRSKLRAGSALLAGAVVVGLAAYGASKIENPKPDFTFEGTVGDSEHTRLASGLVVSTCTQRAGYKKIIKWHIDLVTKNPDSSDSSKGIALKEVFLPPIVANTCEDAEKVLIEERGSIPVILEGILEEHYQSLTGKFFEGTYARAGSYEDMLLEASKNGLPNYKIGSSK